MEQRTNEYGEKTKSNRGTCIDYTDKPWGMEARKRDREGEKEKKGRESYQGIVSVLVTVL